MQTKAYDTQAREDAKSLIGKRIEIPVHYDMWMRGARFGTIKALRFVPGHDSEHVGTAYLSVEMDHPQVKRRLKLWRTDWDYIKVLAD
jgi:hypothetical protein